jgi:CheY-like chemotaxis protein
VCDACKSRTVVVLDDDALQLQIMHLLLLSLGIEAEYFQEPASAMESAMRSATPVSLLMDVNLPDHEGHDAVGFATQLRAASAGVHITGISATTPQQPVLSLFDAFLLKPVSAAQLGEAICPYTEKPHPAPIHDGVVRGLTQHMSGAQLASLYDSYFTDAAARLASVEAAIQQDDAVAFRNAAHAIKGSSAMLGIQSVSATTGQMEALCDGAALGHALPQARSLLSIAHQRLEQARLLLVPHLRALPSAAPAIAHLPPTLTPSNPQIQGTKTQ